MHPLEESGEEEDKNAVTGCTRHCPDKRLGHMKYAPV